MHYDDFIAQQVMKNKDPRSSHTLDVRPPTGRLLRTLWSGVRQLTRRIDASSSARDGIDPPPEHGVPRPRGASRRK